MPAHNKLIPLLVLSAFQLFGQSNMRAWKEVVIPKAIQTTQAITDCPSGWTAMDDAKGPCAANVRHFLVDVAVYDGHPIGCANLIPDKEELNKAKKTVTSSWSLSPVSKDGSWIRCNFAHTRMALCLQLPMDAKEIRVVSSTRVPNNPEVIKVEYK